MLMGVSRKDAEVTIRPADLLFKEMTIMATHDNPFTFSKSLMLMQKGIINVDPMISKTFELGQAQRAFESIEEDTSLIKVLLKP